MTKKDVLEEHFEYFQKSTPSLSAFHFCETQDKLMYSVGSFLEGLLSSLRFPAQVLHHFHLLVFVFLPIASSSFFTCFSTQFSVLVVSKLINVPNSFKSLANIYLCVLLVLWQGKYVSSISYTKIFGHLILTLQLSY